MNQGGTGAAGALHSGGQLAADQRRSHALQSLARYFEGNTGLQVADLGGLNQRNLDFVNSFGHRLYADDLIATYDRFFSLDEIEQGKTSSTRLAEFLDSAVGGAGRRVSVVLAWDRLQFLFPQVAVAMVDRLKHVMAPGGLLLALFYPETTGSAAPMDCRIVDESIVTAAPKPPVRAVERFNARSIENLFSGFGGVKFYVTRDSLQEVLIRR
jgi:hypothetical protein